MEPLYKVPVVPNNLRHKETIIQIADALGYMNQVFDDILVRINKSLVDKQTKVSSLQARISTVHEKVVKLAQTKKATQVFSNSKYPMNDYNGKYKSIFSGNEGEVVLKKIKVKLKDPMLVEQQGNVLQFYHVKIKSYINDKNPNASMEGLGSFPANAHLINELLLFNTCKNPYKKYEMSDPFSLQIEENRKLEEAERNGPDAAPKSMTNRLGSMQAYKEDYFYSPDLGQVPTIDVPLDLPDLPGVADDLRYLMDADSVIAPSIQTTPIVPDLPTVSSQQSIASPQAEIKIIETLPQEDKPAIIEELPFIPLPEPEVQDVPISAPLPELPAEAPKTLEIDVAGSAKVAPPTTVSAEARANLMEAIRQAGSLRKTKKHSEVDTPKSSVNRIDKYSSKIKKLLLRSLICSKFKLALKCLATLVL